jgi:threonine dehydratase
MKAYGAEVLQYEFTSVEDIIRAIETVTMEKGLTFIHPFENPLVGAGHGTVGLEILLDLADADIVTIPIGGGLFASSVATAIKLSGSKAKVYAVGPEGACIMQLCFHEKKMVQMQVNERILNTIAESLRAPFTSELAFQQSLKYVDDVVTVTDEEIMQAMKLLWTRLKLVVEPGGSAGFAAILAGKIKAPAGAKLVSVLSGGNVDLEHAMSYLTK